MGNKKILFISIFIFMIVLSIGAVSAADADDAIASSDDDAVIGDSQATSSGSVSGGVDVVTENPWKTSGELSYDIPADAKTIKSADVYVNVYSGSAANTWGADANVSFTTDNGKTVKSETLWTEEGSKDGTVYTVNDHTTKCYSDYMVHYDITDLLTGLNGTSLKINVDTFQMENKSFDGKIKLIALVLAYDDGDDDNISYWINDNQIWTNSNTKLLFDTTSLPNVLEVYLTNVALSSSEASYQFNNEFLEEQIHQSGNYYQYNKWDLTSLYTSSKPNEFVAYGSAGAYGVSYKNVLSVLTAKKGDISVDLSLATERKSTYDIIYPGTYNQIKVNVNTNKNGKYTLQLLADGVVVNTTEVSLTVGSNEVYLIDPTIREINESTVYVPNGFNNVTYTVNLLLGEELVNTSSLKAAILYNGYFDKDLSYPGNDFKSFLNKTITGDIVIDVSAQAYVSDWNNRTDVWNVALPSNSNFEKAFVYVAYSGATADSINWLNVTFNGVKPTAVFFSRDQANVISVTGYGLIVYDVTDLIKSGENTFVLNKTNKGGVYPSTLIYMYNTTGSNIIKTVYISNGADLLGTYGNAANRPIAVESVLNVDSSVADSAVAYIFGAGSQTGRASIIINGEENTTAWDTSASNQINIYTKDISNMVKDSNDVVIILKNSMFTTLQQIIVTSTIINPTATVSLATERKSTYDIVYPGTFNQIKATVNTDKKGRYILQLLADGVVVNTTEVSLTVGSNEVYLIDPTIREINESTVYVPNGFNNVTYTVNLLLDNQLVNTSSLKAAILYNGYFSKDLSYPGQDFSSFYNGEITGDIVIDVSGQAYVSDWNNRTDVWNVALPGNSNFVKAWVYVAYSGATADSINWLNVTFNGVKPTAVFFSRDQANVISVTGYGLIVYDVTDLIKSGENTLVLNKTNKGGVYPSTLIYLYNTTGSKFIKDVYISNGADLFGTYGNAAGRVLQLDTTLIVDSANAIDATAYIFGAGSQTGRANIIINGEENTTAWDTSASNQINIYTKDISKTVKNSNDVSIVLKSSMFTALQQIIVLTKDAPVEKVSTVITAPAVTKVYNNDKNLVVTLKDSNGNAIANAKLTIVLNGAKKVLTTNAKGQVTLAIPNLVPKTYTASISYAGDDTHIKSSASAKVVVKKADVKLTAKKKTFKAKVKTKKYTVTLKNNKGKAMKKVKLTLKIKKKTFKATTNAKGKATFKIKKLTKKGTYKGKLTFKGDKYFNKLVKTVKIKVKK